MSTVTYMTGKVYGKLQSSICRPDMETLNRASRKRRRNESFETKKKANRDGAGNTSRKAFLNEAKRE